MNCFSLTRQAAWYNLLYNLLQEYIQQKNLFSTTTANFLQTSIKIAW
jgi:hypothetical protein